MKNELQNVNMTVEKLRELQTKFIAYSDTSYKTMLTYTISLRQFFNYMDDHNITNPTREDIIDYKNSIKDNLKPTTVNGYITAVKVFFKWLEYEGLYKNIADNVKTLKNDKKHLKRGFSDEEVKAIVDSCVNLREKVLIGIAITCALRSNEIANIQLKDFYEDDGVVLLKVMGKGKDGEKIDSVKVDNKIFELVKEYCKEYNITDYLFTSNSNHNKGGKINNITLRRWFDTICERANINMDRVSLHSTRHYSATKAIKNGASIQETSEFLRHSNISTTMIYIDEMKKKDSKIADNLANGLF